MNILAIGPHPDDIEIGCGGTLIKYAKRGHKIFLLLITKGEKGGNTELRYQEQLKAAEIIGARDVFWAGFKDTELPDKGNEMIHTVERYIDSIKPHFIFINFFDDTHQDHRTVNRSVLSATRYVKNVLFYEVPTTNNFTPQVFVDISESLDKKIKALEAHESQVMKTNIEDLSIVELARSSANFRGIQGRVKYAEAFCPLRLFINI
ncbi:MAG: PIG-L family deacetylase [Deltaproteobacteria bacterium]|nr:PIG-L family deacetylase [Deltaproteobacteria bacterium]MBW1737652.1 PIG-L family deacetylase [Deltaproteobacteria bacterium]MBW1908184.1 PIG-L family deacetylase [Deltaproteobacteria bacterium]MBW2032865.1 PIG-L family deacetylase [Deltaproteobacteria bacterium]MBW2114693.1 PIG-L family deacetylase [Deltaproteobacteria bacterium]